MLSVTPSRDYGIVMGEIVSSEVRVAVVPGFELQTANLPQAGSAVDDFLELRESSWSKQGQGAETVYRIRLVYQVFKGVRDAETVEVPALMLRFGRGAETVEAQVPAWRFTLQPLIPAQMLDEAVVVRGDLPPPTLSATHHGRWLAVFLTGLAGLGIWQAWQSGLLRRHAPPFARARSGLRKLGKKTDLEAWRQGARLLHEALNETAGRVVFAGQLEGFLAEQPQFLGLRAELEEFFAWSERLFFVGDAALATDYPWAKLEALCRKLAAAGRRG